MEWKASAPGVSVGTFDVLNSLTYSTYEQRRSMSIMCVSSKFIRRNWTRTVVAAVLIMNRKYIKRKKPEKMQISV